MVLMLFPFTVNDSMVYYAAPTYAGTAILAVFHAGSALVVLTGTTLVIPLLSNTSNSQGCYWLCIHSIIMY